MRLRARGVRAVALLLAATAGTAAMPMKDGTRAARAVAVTLPVPFDGKRSAEIEPYAAYDGQTKCNRTPRPGTLAFAKLLLERFGGGMGRINIPCSGSSVSEHKEGRAFDWVMNAHNQGQRDRVKKAFRWLFKEDWWGNKHSRARRLGVMYIIWNKRMWRAYRPQDGWQPYEGVAHDDHVHFSFARKGGQGVTSFWTGEVAVLPGAWIPGMSRG